MKIKYVGVKLNGSTAFSSESGVPLWLAGDVHEIKDAVAAKMLKHPDVFALDVQESDTMQIPEEDAELLAMTRDDLKALAKSLNLDVHHNAGVPTLIKAIQLARSK